MRRTSWRGSLNSKPFLFTVPLAPDVRTTIPVPRNFLLLENLAPYMLTKSDKRPFSMYLLLRRYAAEKGTLSFPLDLMQVAEDMQIAPDRDKWARRKYAIKAVRTLAERYGLIDVVFERGKDAQVTLREDRSLLDEGFIGVPLAYWTYDLATELDQSERHLYLVCLNEENQSITPPLWRKSQEKLAKAYAISRKLINDGLNGLQRRDILTILRSTIPTEDFKKRRPNGYRLKPLLSPEQRASRWQELETKHSPELISQARSLAATLGYGNDFASADQLAKAITTHGYEAVSNTTAQVAAKTATNPYRHPDTVTTYLQNTRRPR